MDSNLDPMEELANKVVYKQNFWRVTFAHILELTFKGQYPFIILTLMSLTITVGVDYSNLVNAIGITGLWKSLIYFPYYILFVLFFVVTLVLLLLGTYSFFMFMVIIFGVIMVDLLAMAFVFGSDIEPVVMYGTYVISLLVVATIFVYKYRDTLKYMFKPHTFSVSIDKDRRTLILRDGDAIQISEEDRIILRRKTVFLQVYGIMRKRRSRFNVPFLVWELILVANNTETILFTNQPYYRRIDFWDMDKNDVNQIRSHYYWDWMDNAAEFIAKNLSIARIEDTGTAYLLSPLEVYDNHFKFRIYISLESESGDLIRGSKEEKILKPTYRNGNKVPGPSNPDFVQTVDRVVYEPLDEGYRIRFKPIIAHSKVLALFMLLLTYLFFTQVILLILASIKASDALAKITSSGDAWLFLFLLASGSIGIFQHIVKSEVIDVADHGICISDNIGPIYYRTRKLLLSNRLFLMNYGSDLEICDDLYRFRLPGSYGQNQVRNIQRSLNHILVITRSLSELIDFELVEYSCYSCGSPIKREDEACPHCNITAPSCIICFVNPCPEDKIVRYQCCSSYAHYTHAIRWNEKKRICPYCKSKDFLISKVVNH